MESIFRCMIVLLIIVSFIVRLTVLSDCDRDELVHELQSIFPVNGVCGVWPYFSRLKCFYHT